jgi:vancomycin resistance protein YoaR
MPGGEFSFNEAVGPTIKKRGYLAGKIFVNGRTAMGYGGGVCQVSSTLFCAADKMGLLTTERHYHSLPVNYVPKGMDAATSYGVIDYKFVNTKDFPIIIKTLTKDGKIHVGIFEYFD